MPRAQTIKLTGTFDNRSTGAASLTAPGDIAIVKRDVVRMFLMKCPCGCGDVLVVNLDSRASAAWRLYQRGNLLSVYPSYWRDSKCCSHFIIWKNSILWCDWDDDDPVWANSNEIEDRVLQSLTDKFTNYRDLAEKIGDIPWDVLQACYSLVGKGKAVIKDRKSGEFCRNMRIVP